MTSEGRRLRVTGRVQGVFFRAWTVETARGLGLAGWVRNRADGSVEIEAFGLVDALDALETACREGPSQARVDAVETGPAAGPVPEGFAQRETS